MTFPWWKENWIHVEDKGFSFVIQSFEPILFPLVYCTWHLSYPFFWYDIQIKSMESWGRQLPEADSLCLNWEPLCFSSVDFFDVVLAHF